MKTGIFLMIWAGGCKYRIFLASSADPNINYKFEILTSRAIDWYINESILRGSGGGGYENYWVVLQNFTGPLSRNMNIFLGSSVAV